MEREPPPAAPPATPPLAEALVRILRHEIADLLQTVYATVAILQESLPRDWAQERRIIGDLRRRGEDCKNVLDAVHDLVCPLLLSDQPVILSEVAATLVSQAAGRHPQLHLHAEAEPTPEIEGDLRRLTQAGELLLLRACQSARRDVWFRTRPGPGPGEVEWTVSHDGEGLTPDQVQQELHPFTTTRHSLSTLALALAQKIVQLHGGRLTVTDRPEGGVQVQVVLPRVPNTPRPARATPGAAQPR